MLAYSFSIPGRPRRSKCLDLDAISIFPMLYKVCSVFINLQPLRSDGARRDCGTVNGCNSENAG